MSLILLAPSWGGMINGIMTGLHEKIEKYIGVMMLLILATISVGGLVQIVPLFFMHSTTRPVEGLKPYMALQFMGRDIYVREGRYVCHSQMIRPFRAETERYSHYSLAGEFVYLQGLGTALKTRR